MGIDGTRGQPEVAIAGDGRALVVWVKLDMNGRTGEAQYIAPDGSPEGTTFAFTDPLPYLFLNVTALSDDRFAVVWTDPDADRLRLQRWSDSNPPNVDEAPWPETPSPRTPAIAATEDRLVVIWENQVDGDPSVLNGQLLAY